jgi:hypothetical protein
MLPLTPKHKRFGVGILVVTAVEPAERHRPSRFIAKTSETSTNVLSTSISQPTETQILTTLTTHSINLKKGTLIRDPDLGLELELE